MANGNRKVFPDVDTETNTILEHASCIVPSMADTSISKHSSHDDQDSDRENEPIFAVLKEAVESTHEQDDIHTDDVDGDEDVNRTPASKHRTSMINPARVPKWTLETMSAAMDSVLAGELTTSMAARRYNIPRTTLLDRLSMKVKTQYLEVPGSFPLSPENDALIVNFVKQNMNLDKQTLIKGILSHAEELASQQGKPFTNPLMTRKWLKLFVHKHPNLDILRTASKSRCSIQINEQRDLEHRLRLTPQQISTIDLSNPESSQEFSPAPDSDECEVKYSQTAMIQRKQHQELEDSFENNLAKQGLDAVEKKLSPEQKLYFSYRFFNSALEKGYELWRLCKTKVNDSESFESVLSAQALNGIENALDSDHLKYFIFRYENSNLEEGYKLWLLLKEKSS